MQVINQQLINTTSITTALIRWFNILIILSFITVAILAQSAIAQPSCKNSEADNAASTVDDDADGLIEICTIAGLNAIRYQLNGTGYRATDGGTKVTSGCPNNACRGYELVKDLDFDTDESYSYPTPAGWEPIGDYESSTNSNPFTATFEGNGHTISNLRINQPDNDYVGLFGYVAQPSGTPRIAIANVGLLNVNVRGKNDVGGLVGWNHIRSTIISSYVVGAVSGHEKVGGLVGHNSNGGTIANSYAVGRVAGHQSVGGLLGLNSFVGNLINSYATGRVTASYNVGGLVGLNRRIITNSYATGEVIGVDIPRPPFVLRSEKVGGLVGYNTNGGIITNGYATGRVEGGIAVGGLVGQSDQTINYSYATGVVTGRLNVGGLIGDSRASSSLANSYWDQTSSGMTTSSGGTGQSTMQLQSPITATGIYSNWNTADWNFGTDQQYPLLKYAKRTINGNVTCREASDTSAQLPICGTLLFPASRYGLSSLTLEEGTLFPNFSLSELSYNGDGTIFRYTGTVFNHTNKIKLIPVSINPSATIRIHGDEIQTIDSGTASSEITLGENAITTVVIEISADASRTVSYNLALSYVSDTDSDDDEIYDMVDIDDNNNGLIEIRNIVDLNAIRHQLDGTSYKATADGTEFTAGCLNNKCSGYELVTNLDFDDYRYPTPAGWEPIGNAEDPINPSPFTAIFEGNGHTIANLMINTDINDVGLFGYLAGANAVIRNIGLLNVDVRGKDSVGGLVGTSNQNSAIINSYVTGDIAGNWYVGGLVGLNGYSSTIINSYTRGNIVGVRFVGGLVGTNFNNAIVNNSYAQASVTGDSRVGGLIGWNHSIISNGYATGDVTGIERIGGLVGNNWNGTLSNSYAIGEVTGDSEVGGLVGFQGSRGSVTNSHWDTTTSGRESSAGGAGQSTVELQSPTAPDATSPDRYTGWNTNNWHFGTSTQYPTLKYFKGSDTANPACRESSDTSTKLPVCGALLPFASWHGLSLLTLTAGNLFPDFNPSILQYTGSIFSLTNKIVVIPVASDSAATIRIRGGGINQTVTSGARSNEITLDRDGVTVVTIEVTSSGSMSQMVTYTLNISYVTDTDSDSDKVYDTIDIDADDDGLIEIRDIAGLNAVRYQLDGTGYRARAITNKITRGCPTNGCKGYELVNDLDVSDDAGWEPIGDYESDADNNPFTSIFEGNGHTISNLIINQSDSDYVGLFGYLAESSTKIRNIGLLGVDVAGKDWVGGLVGYNSSATIANSYATGSVTGDENVGGLVGQNSGTITNSYARGNVEGSTAGGLVGNNSNGTVTNNYAVGNVEGANTIGGLVGQNSSGTVTNSYAVGNIMGDGSFIGGLVGRNGGDNPVLSNNYWNKETSGQTSSAGSDASAGLTTMQLRSPTAENATNPDRYTDWNANDWDFGTASDYPKLKYASGSDTDDPACHQTSEAGQPKCGTVLPNQNFPPTINTTATVVVGSDKVAVEFDDITEGDTVELDSRAMDSDGDSLTFLWTEEGSNITSRINKTKATLQFTVPATYASTMTSRTLIFVVSVNDGANTIQTERITLNVKPKDNGFITDLTAPTFESGTTDQLNAPTLSANDDPDGVDEDTITYQWQSCASTCLTNDDWTNISGATQASYTIPPGTSQQTQFRVRIIYQDTQGYQKTLYTASILSGGIRMRLKLFLEGALQ